MPRATLVIGGTRNLGPDLVRALLDAGDQVTVVNRGVTPGGLPPGVERRTADRSDRAALAAALGTRAFDLVVDTTLYTGADARAAADLLDGRAGRYVFWSTGQVYLVRTGPAPPFVEADYDGPLMPEPPRGAAVDHDNWTYGVGKRAAEDALARAHAARRFPYVSLRMPMINSARDHYGRLAFYVRALRAREAVWVPDDQAALRHVFGGDVVRATLAAAGPAVPAGSCLNVSPDESLTLEALLAIIADALGTGPVRRRPAPRAELEAAGRIGPWSGRWMSVLDGAAGRRALGLDYTPARDYLPTLAGALGVEA